MNKNVLFLIMFVAIVMIACGPKKSDPILSNINFRYYQTMEKDGKIIWAVVDEDGKEWIPFSEEYTNITTGFNDNLFIAEKNGKKFLYNPNGKFPFKGGEFKNYKKHTELKFKDYAFRPEVRFDLKTDKGLLILYGYEHPYGFFQDFQTGEYGYFFKVAGDWGYHRLQIVEQQYINNVVEPTNTPYASQEILSPHYDEIYEIHGTGIGKPMILACRNGKWNVFDMDGNILKDYPWWINKNLPNKARKTYDLTQQTTVDLFAPYPQFYGNQKVGIIFCKPDRSYHY